MAVHLAVAGDVFDGVLFCAVLSFNEMSRSELSQFMRIFVSSLSYNIHGQILKETSKAKYLGVTRDSLKGKGFS